MLKGANQVQAYFQLDGFIVDQLLYHRLSHRRRKIGGVLNYVPLVGVKSLKHGDSQSPHGSGFAGLSLI